MMLKELSHKTNTTPTPAGRLCNKLQGYTATANTYAYSPNAKPHAVRRYYNGLTNELYSLLWDANGNLAQIAEYNYDPATEITTLQDFHNHYWDEDDRLNMVLDNSHFSYYLYGNDGQRVAKLTGSAFTLGTGFATNALLDNYTLYPSEYLVVTQQGYTKYYYAGGTRIASKLGSGGFEKMQRLCTEELNLTANANALFNSVVAKIGDDMPEYHISDPCPDYYPDIAGFRVQLPTLNFEPNFGITAQQNILQTFRQNYANEETYYFHGNHLGSANWVTLQNASPTQFLLHLPYGEEFVKQLSGSYDERFTFTGKEKDIETGYYYFGARFDNVDLGFMSVDPMADKYPSISPYAYCAWNPVKLVDPEGREVDITHLYEKDKHGNYIYKYQVSAFEAFMNTKTGRKEISKYAKAGQVILGHKFDKNGEYHRQRINLSFEGSNERTVKSGVTISSLNDNKLHITICIFTGDRDIGWGVEAIAHELLVHARQDSKDYLDDGELNYSHAYKQLYDYAKNNNLLNGRYVHHWQEQNKDHVMENIGIRILQEHYNNVGEKKEKKQLYKMIEFLK